MFNLLTPTDMNTSNIIATSNKDIEVAAFMVAKSHGTINPVLLGAKIAMVAEVKRRLAKGEIVELDFVKKGSQELRHMVCCLYGNLIAPKIKGTGVSNSVYGNQTVWDLQKNAFRCFSYETIVRVY